MYIVGTLDYSVARANIAGTLWRCEECDSFVSIHCTKPVNEPMCPTCAECLLDFCGTFDSILGKNFTVEKSN